MNKRRCGVCGIYCAVANGSGPACRSRGTCKPHAFSRGSCTKCGQRVRPLSEIVTSLEEISEELDYLRFDDTTADEQKHYGHAAITVNASVEILDKIEAHHPRGAK